ncbi:MAG: adenosylcobinamide-GDP ribazoletransferase [Caulobacteraceae bacterium]|nr:adenosylcobinamide-GDP ribazoletransferase [Caulobacteraceae bacterium]
MRRQARRFLYALQFLTRLPTPRLAPPEADWLARSAPYYPVAGWVVGACAGAVFWIASQAWSGWPAAVLALAAGALLTGGFHEDGLADTADGLGGGATPERRLEIMKDSRIGGYGALAIWMVLALKAAALAQLAPLQGALALVLVHGAARAAAVPVMAALPYARAPGAAKLPPAEIGVRPAEAAGAMVLGFAPLLMLAPRPGAIGAILAVAAAGALALAARRLVGGWTGDVLGAVEQLAEAALLLGFCTRLGGG